MKTLAMNKKFEELIFVDHKYVVLIGGIGSGKSYAMVQLLGTECISGTNKRIFIVGESIPSIKSNYYYIFEDVFGNFGYGYTLNKSKMCVDFHKGSRISFGTIDKASGNYDAIWVDNTDNFTEDEIDGLSKRLKGGGQLFLSFNPPPKVKDDDGLYVDHWLEKRFKNNTDKDTFIHHSTYKDNRFISDDFISLINEYEKQNI